MSALIDTPLAGIRVLDAGQYVTGPFAGMMLGDLGADVVKVEAPGRGDPMRNFGILHKGVSASWLNVNRGKRSVSLDLKSSEGHEALIQLITVADVFLHNWRPEVAVALNLGDAVLEQCNPSLVSLSMNGFGPTGPLSNQPVFDGMVQARSGLAHAQGSGKRPELLCTIAVDKVTAMFGTQAVIAALLERTRTGRGRRIDMSMLAAGAYWNFPDLFQSETFRDSRQRVSHNINPVVETADGYVVVYPVSGAQIGRTLDAMGLSLHTSELRAIPDHSELMRALCALVEVATRTMPTAEVLQRFARFDVPAAPVLDNDAHLEDPQVVASAIYDEVSHPDLGPVRIVRYPARFDGRALPTRELKSLGVGAGNVDIEHDWLAQR